MVDIALKHLNKQVISLAAWCVERLLGDHKILGFGLYDRRRSLPLGKIAQAVEVLSSVFLASIALLAGLGREA